MKAKERKRAIANQEGISWRKSFTVIAALASALLLGSTLALSPASAFEPEALARLNDEAEQAINQKNYQLAIQKLQQALKIDQTNEKARANLAIAYNEYGLSIAQNQPEAIKCFHRAAMLAPGNPAITGNLDGTIEKMGKNPRDFATRVALGKVCQATADFIGAIVEFREAVKIKDDFAVRGQLGDIYRVRGEDDQAIKQYKAALRLKDSASIEVKLGQAYLSRKMISKAKSAFRRAMALKKKEPDDTDDLVEGWQKALKNTHLPEPGEKPVLVPYLEDSRENLTKLKEYGPPAQVPGWDEAVKEWNQRNARYQKDSREAK